MTEEKDKQSRRSAEGQAATNPPRVFSILTPGLHFIREEDLFDLFVRPFASRERRIELLGGVKMLIQHIRATGVRCEMWIDGSFASAKEWPNDVDVALFFERTGVTAATERQYQLLEEINNRPLMRAKYSADVYIDPDDSPERKRHWEDTFGRDKDSGAPKGIGILRIGYE